MRLRSIVLAGLLGTGALMSSGCGTEDVTSLISSALNTNVINLANARTAQVDFTINGESNLVNSQTNKMAVVTGSDNYVVNNIVVDSPVPFAADSAYLYGLCVSDNVITDSATGGARQIEVINLSDAVLDAGADQNITVTLYGDAGVLATASLSGQILGGCNREVLPISNFTLSAVKTVEVNDINYTVPAYSDEVAAKLDELNDVDFDIVILQYDSATAASVPAKIIVQPTIKATIVPLATATELAI